MRTTKEFGRAVLMAARHTCEFNPFIRFEPGCHIKATDQHRALWYHLPNDVILEEFYLKAQDLKGLSDIQSIDIGSQSVNFNEELEVAKWSCKTFPRFGELFDPGEEIVRACLKNLRVTAMRCADHTNHWGKVCLVIDPDIVRMHVPEGPTFEVPHEFIEVDQRVVLRLNYQYNFDASLYTTEVVAYENSPNVAFYPKPNAKIIIAQIKQR